MWCWRRGQENLVRRIPGLRLCRSFLKGGFFLRGEGLRRCCRKTFHIPDALHGRIRKIVHGQDAGIAVKGKAVAFQTVEPVNNGRPHMQPASAGLFFAHVLRQRAFAFLPACARQIFSVRGALQNKKCRVAGIFDPAHFNAAVSGAAP